MLASDLPKGCLALIPVVSGLVNWGLLGVVLTLLCLLGGLWRLLALQGISAAGSASRWTRAWLWVATFGSIIGIAGFAGRVAGAGSPLAPMREAAEVAWRASALAELTLAMLWIGIGAVERGSRWMLALLGFAAISMVSSVGAQWALASDGDAWRDQPSMVALLGLVMLGGGIVAPVIVADGCSRLLQSMTSETLDEETGIHEEEDEHAP